MVYYFTIASERFSVNGSFFGLPVQGIAALSPGKKDFWSFWSFKRTRFGRDTNAAANNESNKAQPILPPFPSGDSSLI